MKIPKPHQLEGAEFISQRRRCALWYRPRCGKTLTTVLGLEMLGARNVLIVCPVTVMQVWADEFLERGWPEPRLCRGTSSQKKDIAQYREGPVIVSFESAWRLPLATRRWDAIVFDESIRLWNWEAKSVKYWYGNRHITENVILLSGAPCPEGYHQIASQMLICGGAWFGHTDIYAYLREFWTYNSDKYRWECDDHGHLAEVRRRVGLVGLSLTLEDVGALDEKVERYQAVEPQEWEKNAIKDILSQDMPPAQQALKLQMACNGLKGEGEHIFMEGAAKTEAIRDYIKDCISVEPGYRAVVMCRFRVQVDVLAMVLGAAKVHGGITGQARQDQIDLFKQGGRRHIVCQEDTAKMGIDLSAGTEILYASNSWSGDARIQSRERCSRLDRDTPVGIVDFCCHEVEYAIATAVRGKNDFQNHTLYKR